MELSIVILTYNSINDIAKCLDSIRKHLTNIKYEIIIVDNGSTDGTVNFLKSSHPEVKVIENKQNRGVAVGRNIGIKKSEGSIILILDDDTELLPNSVQLLISKLKSDSQIGIIAPQLLNPDKSIQFNALPFPSSKVKLNRILKKLSNQKVLNPYVQYIRDEQDFEPGYVIGACQLIKADVFKKVGLLDENIFYGPEDAEFCNRAINHGYKVLCHPKAKVIHSYQQRSYSFANLKLTWKHICGLLYLWKKTL